MKHYLASLLSFFLYACSNNYQLVKISNVWVNNGIVDYYAQNQAFCPVTLIFKDSVKNLHNHTSRNIFFVPARTKKYFLFRVKRSDTLKWNSKFSYGYTWGRPDLIYDSSYVYDLPFDKTITTKLIKYIPVSKHPNARFMELSSKEGALVKAIRDGVLVDLNYRTLICHNDGSFTYYENLGVIQNRKRGSLIKKGDTLGWIGVDSTKQTTLKLGVFKVQRDGELCSVPIKFDINGVPEYLNINKEYIISK